MPCCSWLPDSQKALDWYHKVICPSIQIALTVFAIIAAWKVLGVHEQNAERANKELDHRIEKLAEFNKVLEKQNNDLKLQQERFQQAEADRHLKTAESQKSLKKLTLGLLAITEMTLRSGLERQSQIAASQQSINIRLGQGAMLQSKLPSYTDDEKRLLDIYAKIAGNEIQTNYLVHRYSTQCEENFKQLEAKLNKNTKNVSEDDFIRLSLEYYRTLPLGVYDIEKEANKELAELNANTKTLMATAIEISNKLAKAKK